MPDNKKKNPLFVVTNNGRDVEEANNVMDLWIKKLGLEPLMNLLRYLMDMIMENVQSYPALAAFNEIFEAMLKDVDAILKRFFPQVYVYRG